MGVNYEEINQNLLRVIENADNQGEFLQHFLGDPAGDVTFSNVATDGSLIKRTIPNLAKFVGDVSASLKKEMSISVYVDPISGDDGNDGRSTATPKKTMSAALNSTPFGATVRLIHLGDVVIDAEESKMSIDNRRVAWVPDADTPSAHVILRPSDESPAVVISRGGSIYSASPIIVDGGGDKKSGIWILEHGVLIPTEKVVCSGSKLVWCRLGEIRLSAAEYETTDTALISCVSGSVLMSINTGATINGDSVIDVFRNYIVGIVYDADSGNPVNALCNINLSL